MNNQVFIPSHLILKIIVGMGIIQAVLIIKKEIPFFKLLHDTANLRMRYYLRINNNALFF